MRELAHLSFMRAFPDDLRRGGHVRMQVRPVASLRVLRKKCPEKLLDHEALVGA
jgi:hypothetical protein